MGRGSCSAPVPTLRDGDACAIGTPRPGGSRAVVVLMVVVVAGSLLVRFFFFLKKSGWVRRERGSYSLPVFPLLSLSGVFLFSFQCCVARTGAAGEEGMVSWFFFFLKKRFGAAAAGGAAS